MHVQNDLVLVYHSIVNVSCSSSSDEEMEEEHIEMNDKTNKTLPPLHNVPVGSTGVQSKSNFEVINMAFHSIHLLLIVFVVYILFITFNSEFVLFSWHPVLLSTGAFLLLTEAILIFSPDNLFYAKQSRARQVQLHWILQSLACVLILLGFLAVFCNKIRKNSGHFKSYHGQLGLASLIFMLLSLVGGISSFYNLKLSTRFNELFVRSVHGFVGVTTYILFISSLTTALFTRWFDRNGSEFGRYACIVILIFASILTIIKPIKTTYKRIIFMLR